MNFRNLSAAAFGQIDWEITDRLSLLPGLRVNYDQKSVNFDQQVYGGLQTDDPRLIALQRSVLAPQAYNVDVDDTNWSGQVTLAYGLARAVNTYATYSTNFKSVGLNLNGLPTDALGRPLLETATVKPEEVRHFEVGVKTEPFRGVTANVTVFNTGIDDFQTQVVNAQVGRAARLPRQRGEGARARRRVRRQRQSEPAIPAPRGAGVYRRHLRVLSRRAAAARGYRRPAGQGHLGFGAPRHLEVGVLPGRRVCAIRRPSSARPGRYSGPSTRAIGPSSRRARRRRST